MFETATQRWKLLSAVNFLTTYIAQVKYNVVYLAEL